VIRPLAERVLQILVRQPGWSLDIDPEITSFLEESQAELLAWIQEKTSKSASTNFAVLHESALAEGRERGSDTVRYFLKLSKPDPALDDLMDDQPDQLRDELFLAISRLKIRMLEEEAARLAADATHTPSALQELQRVRAQIQALRHPPATEAPTGQ
jgi:hypothetical protein